MPKAYSNSRTSLSLRAFVEGSNAFPRQGPAQTGELWRQAGSWLLWHHQQLRREGPEIFGDSRDGRPVLTYIQLAKSQNRPAVYIGKTADPKKLEPVKYTDEGDCYAVHRVLHGSERLYLKSGADTSDIRRR